MTRWRILKHRSRRGIALMLTLVVTFFLMVLLGAFIIVHRGNSSLTVSGQKRQKAFNVCTSGLHYLWGELELNPMFGAAGLPNGPAQQFPPGEPLIEIRYFGEPPEEPGEFPDIESNYIEGKILGTSDTFVVKFINNLENRSAAEGTQLGTVPARCAKVEILGTSGGATLKLESILRKRPFVDYSMLSNQELKLELDPNSEDDKWAIGSQDPYINQIRSNDEILGPSALDHDIQFEGPPRGGVAKATEDIVLGGDSIRDAQSQDPDFVAQSQTNAQGTFQVGTSSVEVPSLSRDDLRLPDNAVTLPGGDLIMRQVVKHEWVPQDFPVYDSNGNVIPDQVETAYRLRKLQHNAVQYENNIWVASRATINPSDDLPLNDPSEGLPSPGPGGYFPVDGGEPLPSNLTDNDDYPYLYQSDDAKVRADLTNGDIAFSPGSKFEFEGDFGVTKEEFALTPNLLMGFELNPGNDPHFAAGEISPDVAAEAPEEYSTALVTSGRLTLEGPVSGYGTLFANDALSLHAQPTLSADPVMAVALHGDSVNFTVAEPGSGDRKLRTFLETDWEVFQKSIDQAPGNDSIGFGSYENWHDLTTTWEIEGKDRVIGDDPAAQNGIRHKKVGLTKSEAAQELANEFGTDPPNFNNQIFSSWGSGELTLEQYVGLREYMRKPDASNRNDWITLNGYGFDSITHKIRRQIDFYAGWAEHMNKDMDEFMTQPELKIADVYFVGLVHAGQGGFTTEADDFSLYFEGALVSQGHIDIKETPWAKFVYNRDYLDDVIKHNFADPIQLDQVYFKLN